MPCFGVGFGAFWDPFWTHSRQKMLGFGVGFGAFWDPFWTHLRSKMPGFGVGFGAFWDPFWTHLKSKMPDFGVDVRLLVVVVLQQGFTLNVMLAKTRV